MTSGALPVSHLRARRNKDLAGSSLAISAKLDCPTLHYVIVVGAELFDHGRNGRVLVVIQLKSLSDPIAERITSCP